MPVANNKLTGDKNNTSLKLEAQSLIDSVNSELFRNIFEQSPLAIELYDEDGKLIDVNQAVLNLFGVLDKNEIQDFCLFDDENIPADEKKKLKLKQDARFQIKFDFEKVKKNKYYKTDKSGILFLDIRISFISFRNTTSFSGYLVYVNDITEYTEAMNKIKTSENKSEFLIENLSELILILSKTGKILFVNNSIFDITGYKKNEVIGKKITDFLTKDSIKQSLFALTQAFIGINHSGFEVKIVTKSGGIKYLDISKTFKHIKEDSEMNGILISARDITEQKDISDALANSEEKFRTLFDYAPDGFYILDNTGKIIDGNKAIEDMFQYKKTELVGKNALKLKLIPLDQVPKAIAGLAKSALGEVTGPDEYIFNRKDGTQLNVEILTHPIKILGKIYTLSIARDITKRKRLELAEREADEKYKTIFNNTGTALAIIEEDTIISLANNEFERLSGYRKDEIEGKISWTKFVRPDDIAKMMKFHKVRRINNSNVPSSYKFHFIDKNKNEGSATINMSLIAGTKKSIASIMDTSGAEEVEEKLKDQIQLENSILNSIPTAVLGLHDRKIIFANQDTEKVFGWKPEELIGKSTTILYRNQNEYDEIGKKVYPVLEKQKIYSTDLDFPCRRKDGKEIICRIKVSIIGDKLVEGKVVVTYEDITEFKRMEQLLKESEKRYKILYESSPDGIIIMDVNTMKFLYANPMICQMLGYSSDEMNKMSIYDIHPDNELEAASKRIINAHHRSDKISSAMRMIKKDGSEIIVDMVGTKSIIDGQECAIGFFRDVTEKTKMEKKLKESEETFRALAEASYDTIMRFDRQLHHLYVNPVVEKETGIPPEKFIGKTHAELGFPPDLTNFFDEAINKVFETGKSNRVDFMLPSKTYIDWMLIPEFDDKGEIKAVITFSRDITEIKKSEELLKYKMELEKLISDISSKFINLSLDDIDSEITNSLKAIGEFCAVDRSYIFLFKDEFKIMEVTYAWWRQGIETSMEKFKNFKVELMPWFKNKILGLEIVSFFDMAEIPETAVADKKIFIEQQIKSLICIPIIFNKILFGFIGLDAVKEKKEWQQDIITLLKVLGDLFANAVMRKKSEIEVKKRADDLERFNKLAVGRELKMIELKKKINELEAGINTKE